MRRGQLGIIRQQLLANSSPLELYTNNPHILPQFQTQGQQDCSPLPPAFFLSTCSHISGHNNNNNNNNNDYIDFATVGLSLSTRTKSPILGTQIHSQIIKWGLYSDVFLQNNLLSMYSKCQALEAARQVFDEITERNLVSWTSMITASIQNGYFDMGLQLYLQMTNIGIKPNQFTLAIVLRACAAVETLEFGSTLHSIALKLGHEVDVFVVGSLLYMYAKCGAIRMAELVFESITGHDLGCWNAMAVGYATNGYGDEVLKLVALMHRKRINGDQYTFVTALNACSILGDFRCGRQIHGLIVQYDINFCSSVANSLTDMYFKTGRKDLAMLVFSQMHQRDVISWNTVISGLAHDGKAESAVGVFYEMLLSGFKPNHITFSILIRLCAYLADLNLGLQFYCHAFRLGFVGDVLITNSLIQMFARCGSIENADLVVESLSTENINTWNEMIHGYNINGCYTVALRLFLNLWESGIEVNEFTYSTTLGACSRSEYQDIGKQIHASIIKSGFGSYDFVGTSLISAYARVGLVHDSFNVFNSMEALDLVAWGAMISAFSQNGCNYEALELFNHLRGSGDKPDEFLLGSALNACANVSAFNLCKTIHVYVLKTGFEKHLCVASSVVDAYAKCGDIESSRRAFGCQSSDFDPILANAMITAYAQHGLAEEAIEVFEKMQKVNLKPNNATFVSVISACSHLGLVEQGRGFFDSIRSDHGMEPSAENFACLIDLLVRCGFLEEAKGIAENMPFEPWPAIWRCLLSGCRIHGNRELGEYAAKKIIGFVPGNDAPYVLLSKVYAQEGNWEDVAKMRMEMEEIGIRKKPGYSWIEI